MKQRRKIFGVLLIIGIVLCPTVCFAEAVPAAFVSFYRPIVTTPYDYKGKDITREGLSAVLGIGVTGKKLGFGVDGFMGGGKLGSDIGEFIAGATVAYRKRFLRERVAVPLSAGFAFRRQWAYIENNLVAMFIDEPKFLQDSDISLTERRDMVRYNFDFMPSIDLQIFIGKSFSMYAGYMCRKSSSGDWKIGYTIPGKTYTYSDGSTNPNGSDSFTVPKSLDPLNDSKENGVFRFGIAINIGGLL